MNTKLDLAEKGIALLISLLGALGIKRFWDILIERTKANVEIKKQDTAQEIAKIEAGKTFNGEITKIKDDQVEFYKNELAELKITLKERELEIKEHLMEIKKLEHEKDQLQNQLINRKQP